MNSAKMQQLVSIAANISREVSVYCKVAVRPHRCCKCGVIKQLFRAYIDERLNQDISTDDVASLAKTPRSSTGGRSCPSRPAATDRSPLRCTHPFHLRRLLGQEKYNPTGGIKLDVIITGPEQYTSTVDNNLVQVAVHQTNLYSISSCLPIGGSLLAQQQCFDVTTARNETTSDLEFDRRDLRRHQHHHSSGVAAVQ